MSSTTRFDASRSPSRSPVLRRNSVSTTAEISNRHNCSSHNDFDFLRKTGRRAIDDMGMRLRAFRKAAELDNLGVLFVAEARLASAKTRELARHVKERVTYLVSHSALPGWMKDNEFIHGGYRPELKSASRCFRSIFHLHTETGNIWTHLVGCVAFLAVALFVLVKESMTLANEVGFALQDKLMLATFFVSAIACLLFSTLFHTLCCHSESVSYLFSKLDYCGIALLITGSNIPWIYFAFYCNVDAMRKYVGSCLLLGCLCIAITLSKRFGAAKYRALRACVFTAFGLCGLVPVCHFLMDHGPEAAYAYAGGYKLVLMAVLYLLGALIYAARIPERFLPGRFDLFCHSHQIFHVCVVAAAFATLHGLHDTAVNALRLSNCSDQ